MRAAIEQKLCIHCGTAFPPQAHRAEFCCAGCQFVHGLIAAQGLSQFYELQTGVAPPVRGTVFHIRDFTWLSQLVQLAEHASSPRLKLAVQGVSCLACTWLIEKLFQRCAGGVSIRVDSNRGECEIRWEAGSFDAAAFAGELQSFGYMLGPPDNTGRTSSDRGLLIRIGLCGSLAMNTMLYTVPSYLGLQPDAEWAALFQRLSFVLGTISMLIGGSWFFLHAWRGVRAGLVHIDLPISLGLLAAYGGSVYAFVRGDQRFVYFDFISTFTFLMLVGRWLQQRAIARNRHRVLASAHEPPPVEDSESGEPLPASDISAGRRFRVRPGKIVPVRAELLSTSASFALEWITGESDATVARKGRVLPGGATNSGRESVEFIALEAWNDSLLARLMRSVPDFTSRHPSVERFLRWYLVCVIGIGSAGFAGWWLFGGAPVAALQVFISVLVVSCPCASGVAVPLCTDLAVARLARLGVFLRSKSLWERLSSIRQLVFDKTGTLTLGTISLRNPEALSTLCDEQRSILLAMVQGSYHPVSGCLREELLAHGVTAQPLNRVHEEIGLGVEAIFSKAVYRLGRPEWCADTRADFTASEDPSADSVFARDGEILTRFTFHEETRLHAEEEIAALHGRGLGIQILSGDRRSKVNRMAQRLGILLAHAQGELTPGAKADWLRANGGAHSLYLGDGANDALAFEVACVTGAAASDRGLLEQKADFYFVGQSLHGVRALFEIAACRRRAVRTVIAFAILYNAAAVAVSLAGRMNPLLAAVLMPASSLAALGIACRVMLGREGTSLSGAKVIQKR